MPSEVNSSINGEPSAASDGFDSSVSELSKGLKLFSQPGTHRNNLSPKETKPWLVSDEGGCESVEREVMPLTEALVCLHVNI